MYQIFLVKEEISDIQTLLLEITNKYSSVESSEFLEEAALYAHELPKRLKKFLLDFKLQEGHKGACVVSGFPVDNKEIGKTPSHWENRSENPSTLKKEFFFFLCGSLVGDPFGWSTQQNGHIMHDLSPIKKYETEQVGASSKGNLEWHTEDAFHEYRPDYIGLMCMRNPTQTPTTMSSVADVKLTKEQIQILSEPHFTIRPDISHLEEHQSKVGRDTLDVSTRDSLDDSYHGMDERNENPDKIPVLFGDLSSPYLRIDPAYMNPAEDESAAKALDVLIQQLDQNLHGVTLTAGDVCFFDNYRVVHGRPPFEAKYDGNDRWMKRLNVTRDLRKSRSSRKSASCRKIY